MTFVHLHTHSDVGSLLDGIARLDDLARTAAEMGQPALALTDHGSLGGALQHYRACQKYGIKPILGYEAYLTRTGTIADARAVQDKSNYHLTLLAQDAQGWQNLLKLATIASTDGFYQKPRIDRWLLSDHGAGLIVLSGCMSSEVSRLLLDDDYGGAMRAAVAYRSVFGDRFYLEIHEHGMHDEKRLNAGLLSLAAQTGIPLVAANDSHYLRRADEPLHAIAMRTQTGGKMGGFETPEFYLKSVQEMLETGLPANSVHRTCEVAERCNVTLSFEKQELPLPPSASLAAHIGGAQEEFGYLAHLAEEGMDRVYGLYWDRDDQYRDRLHHELAVFQRTGYVCYALVMADLARYARSQGIPSTARGSAAGSLVLYALGITPIDPIRYSLSFERFLNEGRAPDIDLDVADDRRADLLTYLSNTYGHDRVAQIITFGTMGGRASLRDVARALGYPYEDGDRLAKLVPQGSTLAHAVEKVRELPADHPVVRTAVRLEGTARSSGTHAAGVVIAGRPLVELVPLTRAKQDGTLPLTQWEMGDVEAAGLTKLDILGLANLSIVARTIALVKEHLGKTVDLATLPLDDHETYALLSRAQTTGVFQLESGGMRRYLRELRPDCLDDLMAMVALYRPGPLAIIPDFIARKHGRQPVQYAHPSLEPILRPTYGLMVYQEAIMDIAHKVAGFTLYESDQFLKAVRKKVPAVLLAWEPRFRQGCTQAGLPDQAIQAIWDAILPFADYGFNRAHAACYALLAYQTAYLKCHYPAEYLAALLTSEAGDPHKVAAAVTEAHRMGVDVLPPDVSRSGETFTVERGAVRVGLAGVKGVGPVALQTILAQQPFRDLDDFQARVPKRQVNSRVLAALTDAGALDAWGARDGVPLVDRLVAERTVLGMSLSASPLAPYLGALEWHRTTYAGEMDGLERDEPVAVGGQITEVRKLTTKRDGSAMASVTLEDETGMIQCTVFPRVYAQVAPILQEGCVLVFGGKADYYLGEPQVIVQTVLPLAPDRQYQGCY